MFFGYNALSVEEQTDVGGFSMLFSLKVFSPEIMQILLKLTDSRVTQRARIFRPQSIRDQ